MTRARPSSWGAASRDSNVLGPQNPGAAHSLVCLLPRVSESRPAPTLASCRSSLKCLLSRGSVSLFPALVLPRTPHVSSCWGMTAAQNPLSVSATLALLPGAPGLPRVQPLPRADAWHTLVLRDTDPGPRGRLNAGAFPVPKRLTTIAVGHNTPQSQRSRCSVTTWRGVLDLALVTSWKITSALALPHGAGLPCLEGAPASQGAGGGSPGRWPQGRPPRARRPPRCNPPYCSFCC